MEIVKQILLIVLVSVVVMAVFMPLAQTSWADNMRGEASEENQGMEGKGAEGMSPVIMSVSGFIKEFVIMGIPMLITLGVLRVKENKR